MQGFEDFYFPSTREGVEIYARIWPAKGEARALVHVLHGLNGEVSRYDALADFLTEEGFVVFGQDFLGHGQSVLHEEERGYFAPENGDQYVLSDLIRLQRRVQKQYKDLPMYVIGHSMGSFFLRRLLMEIPEEIHGAVIMGTGSLSKREYKAGSKYIKAVSLLHDEYYRPGYVSALGLYFLNHRFHKMHERDKLAWVSNDLEVIAKRHEEKNANIKPTLRLYGDLNRTLGILAQEEHSLQMRKECPIFLMYGEYDPMAKAGRVQNYLAMLYKAAGLSYVSLKEYPEGRHELLTDINKKEVMQDILTWLEACLVL